MIASHFDRLDVWHRNVPWSRTKQLRTVVETELSVDDIFDCWLSEFEANNNSFYERIKRHARSTNLRKVAAASQAYAFILNTHNTSTCLLYRYINLPWYVTMQCFRDEIRV